MNIAPLLYPAQNSPSFGMTLHSDVAPLKKVLGVMQKTYGVSKDNATLWLSSMNKSIDDKVTIKFDTVEKLEEDAGHKVTGVAILDTAVSAFSFTIDPLLKQMAAKGREFSMLAGYSAAIRTAANNVLNAKSRFTFKLSELSDWFSGSEKLGEK